MKTRPPLAQALFPAVLLVVVAERTAWAIVPAVLQPLQALLSFLPQLLLGLLVGVTVIFRPSVLWQAVKNLAGKVRARPGRAAAVTAFVLLFVAAVAWSLHPAKAVTWRAASVEGDGRGVPPGANGGGGGAAAGTGGAWTTLLGNFRRTGVADGLPGPREGRVAWRFGGTRGSPSFATTAAYADGRIFAGADDSRVYCLDAETGEVRWKFALRHGGYSSPVTSGGRVYVGEGDHETKDARLYCLEAATGTPVWSFATRSHLESSPTLVGDRVFAGAGEDGIYCVDAARGTEVWHFSGPHVDTSPAVADGRVWFGGGWGDPSVYCLDAGTGSLVWQKKVRYEGWGPPAYDEGRVYIGTGNADYDGKGPDLGGEVLCLDGKTGEAVWRFAVGGPVMGAVALDGGAVFFGSHDGGVYCVEAATGARRWRFEAGGRVIASPAVEGATVYAATGAGRVVALGAKDGVPRWTFDAKAETGGLANEFVSSPTLAGGRLYVGAQSYYFFCLR